MGCWKQFRDEFHTKTRSFQLLLSFRDFVTTTGHRAPPPCTPRHATPPQPAARARDVRCRASACTRRAELAAVPHRRPINKNVYIPLSRSIPNPTARRPPSGYRGVYKEAAEGRNEAERGPPLARAFSNPFRASGFRGRRQKRGENATATTTTTSSRQTFIEPWRKLLINNENLFMEPSLKPLKVPIIPSI